MLNIKRREILTLEKEVWCSLSIHKVRIKAKIHHIGGGKFEILDDESGGEYTGNIVDASDVYHCK